MSFLNIVTSVALALLSGGIDGARPATDKSEPIETVRNLEIVQVDTDENVLMVKGAIPGPNGGYVVVKPAKKRGGR